jgi:hypothetical protein
MNAFITFQLEELKRSDPGFDFCLLLDQNNVLKAAIWMTGCQRRRLNTFGDAVFLDGSYANVKEQFQMFLPSILNQQKKLFRVAHAVAETENTEAIHFVLRSMMSMCEQWQPVTLFMDAKLSQATIQDVLPNVRVHICCWHWLELDVPARLGHQPNFHSIKQDLYNLKDTRDEKEFEEQWERLKVNHPQSVEYLTFWYKRKENWARAWTYRSLTLGCDTSSPAESSNASFKSWMSESEADLTSLLKTR